MTFDSQVLIMFGEHHWKSSISRAVAAAWLVLATTAVLPTTGLSQPIDETALRGAGSIDGMLARARYLQEQSEHELVIPILQEALQVTRMTLGLYHEDQLEILDSLIQSEIAGKNWQRVDDHHALLLNLYEVLYAGDSINLEMGLVKVTGWHVDALRYDLDGRTVAHLREARKLLKARLHLAQRSYSPDARKIEYLREGIGIAEAHLMLYSDSNTDQLRREQALRRELLLSSLE